MQFITVSHVKRDVNCENPKYCANFNLSLLPETDRFGLFLYAYVFYVDSLLFSVAYLHINVRNHLLTTAPNHGKHLSQLSFNLNILGQNKSIANQINSF